MRHALRRHDAILRMEIEARGGYVFKTIGDAFCAAFPSVAEALDAAVAAQRHLSGEDFSSVDGIHVRMAIHAGETDERDGDYFGSAVNRTARLLSAGHGGQILLSGEAADLTLATLPADVTLRHLGSLPLRDIKEPQRVYQPIGPQLRTDFKALRAIETPPNNLPRQTTSFVGRYEDLARVEALLDEGALVTITGAGGIGKTRLALEVAAGRLNDVIDGVWFVDLSSIANAGLIAGTILTSLGGELSADREPLDDLLVYLEKRDLLLVLDNSEHLVADVAAIVAQIVARCAHVTVLATSRSPLDIAAERVYRLSSLEPSSAVQLFAERARAANPSFSLEPHESVVAEICARLDGIALAIELAAARVRTMSVNTLASHLELRLLTGGRDRRPRQQTMRALIDWSYDLLTDEERDALCRAAVFVRGFTLRSAIVVFRRENDEWCVIDLLTSLVDKSLLIVEDRNDEQRYRILEPIREYAHEKLVAAGDLAETLRRYVTAFVALAHSAYEEWDRGPGPQWLARFEAELANIRVALAWAFGEGNDRELGAQIAADTTVLFLRLGLLDEGIEYCKRVLESRLTLAPEIEARLRYGLSMLYSNLGAGQECLEEALAAASLYRSVADWRGLARALSQVASRLGQQSKYDDSRTSADEALELARCSNDRYLIADVMRRCGYAFESADRVRETFGESVALFRGLGRGSDTARALQWWAQWEMLGGNYRDAAERLLEAASLSHRDVDAMMYGSEIASCYLAMGAPDRAEPFARQVVQTAAKLRHPVLMAIGVTQLAVIARDADLRKSAKLIGYAEQRFRSAGYAPSSPEDTFIADLHRHLSERIGASELRPLLAEGVSWSDDQAVTAALSA